MRCWPMSLRVKNGKAQSEHMLSAFPSTADIDGPERQFRNVPISRLMHRSKTISLFDDFVGKGEQRRGHSEAKRLRGLEVDRQFELSQPLDWQIAWIGAPEDTTDVESGMTISFRHTLAVANKAA